MSVTNLAETIAETNVEARSFSYVETIYYKVVHWIPGRFRIQIPLLAEDEEYAAQLQYVLDDLDFVTEVNVNPAARSLIINYDSESTAVAIATVEDKLFSAIQRAVDAEIPTGWSSSKGEKKAENEIDFMERLGFPLAGLVMSVAAMAGAPIPPLLIGATIILGAIPVYQRAWEAIEKERQLTIDFLDGLALTLHTAQGHFFAPAFMLGLVEGGEAIRDMTARGSERASLDLLGCLNKTAFVIRDGQVVEIPTPDVVPGDHVIVYPGDQIPVDGAVLEGTGIIDQCKLTGESVPVTRREGEEVFASTLLVDGTLTILAERTGNNTRAGVIVNLMQAAPVHDTRVENYAAQVANQFVLPTLLIGGGVGLVSGNLNRAIALLTLDFGTGIRVSVPTTILSALTYAARNGVLIRSGRAIEILATIDTIVCDKTGTLTIGHAGVNDIDVMDDRFTKNEVLCYAATAEQGLTHPIAEAIVHESKDRQIALKETEDWEYKVGLGAVAKIDGMQIMVGSPRFMKQENIDLEEYDIRYPDAKSGGQSLVYVAGDGKLLGVIRYSDPPRPESKEVIAQLKRMGISLYMLTGDVTRVAESIARNLGMDPNNVVSEAFPEKKVEVVRGLHDSGKTVAFCGDGINDSAALAYADVSVSFAGATDIARETADVVLMEDDLRGLVMAIKVAKQAMEVIWQNTVIVAAPNLGALVAGIFWALDPLLAVVINNGSAILAELNGLRPLMGPGGVTPLEHRLEADVLAEKEQYLKEQAHKPELAERQVVKPEIITEVAIVSPELKTEVQNTVITANGNEDRETETNGSYSNGNEQALESSEQLLATDIASGNPLTQLKPSILANRLGVTTQALMRLCSQDDFTEWCRENDPEGLAWAYDPTEKTFWAVESASQAKVVAANLH